MSTVNQELVYFSQDQDWAEYHQKMNSTDFWLAVNPQLTITETPFVNLEAQYVPDPVEIKKNQRRVTTDGYFQYKPLVERELCATLAEGIRNIIQKGFHPNFCMVYDEYWRVLARLQHVLAPILGEKQTLLGDYWVWHVAPRKESVGWRPHRDFQHPRMVSADRRPTIVSVWIPFTDATPENGCMYILPLSLDPNVPDHLDRLECDQIQDILALPAKAGSVLGWNQYLLHWGGRCKEDARVARISCSIYFQTSELAPVSPLIVPFDAPFPFLKRIAIIASTFLRYESNFRFPPQFLKIASSFVFQHLPAPALTAFLNSNDKIERNQ